MEAPPAPCELCGDPIEVDQAWLRAADESSDAVAHAGCAYSEGSDPAQRGRWMPPDD